MGFSELTIYFKALTPQSYFNMRILQITNNYPTNKFPISGIFVKEQIDSLNKVGITNDLFLINGRENGKLEYPKAIIKLRKILKKGDYKLVHCHHAFSAVIFALTGFSKKIPSVVSFQNDPADESKFNLFNWLKNEITVWIFKNNSIYADGKQGFYLPNGVDENFFKPISNVEACEELNLNANKKYILFVSSNFIREQKRLDIFREVVDILKNEDDSIEELHMINVKRDLVPYYHNAASIHLLTSDFEGSPNSVKEALFCETPVVSTDVGNVLEMLEGINSSFVSKTNQPFELATLCKKALDNKQVNNSRQIMIQKAYSMHDVAKRIIQIYDTAQKLFNYSE